MQFIADALAGILAYIIKFFSEKAVTLPIKIAIASLLVIVIGLYVSAFVLFANFIFKLVNTLYNLIQNANGISASSSFYGVSVSLNTVFAFLNASGIGEALYTVLSLYFSLLFGYLAVKISIISAKAIKETYKMIADASMIAEL